MSVGNIFIILLVNNDLDNNLNAYTNPTIT